MESVKTPGLPGLDFCIFSIVTVSGGILGLLIYQYTGLNISSGKNELSP